MAWISVYQEVDGPKLRRLAKLLDSGKAEALGILNFLWFWGMNNADETGRALEAGREDIEDAIAGVSKISPATIVDALFTAGWLDDVEGDIYLHDWDQWQEQWYKLQRTRKSKAEYMRRTRSEEKAARGRQDPQEGEETPRLPPTPPDVPAVGEEPKSPAPQKAKSAEKGPEKKKYAEFVRMTEDEYEKLIEKYGMPFTVACIEELDNYKGAKGKTYKSDYRAILSWVADRVNEKRPGLMRVSKETAASTPKKRSDDPYAEWGEEE